MVGNDVWDMELAEGGLKGGGNFWQERGKAEIMFLNLIVPPPSF